MTNRLEEIRFLIEEFSHDPKTKKSILLLEDALDVMAEITADPESNNELIKGQNILRMYLLKVFALITRNLKFAYADDDMIGHWGRVMHLLSAFKELFIDEFNVLSGQIFELALESVEISLAERYGN